MQTNSAPVQKITIIPRTSGALGYTMQVEEGEHFLINKTEMENKIATFTGGRAAEELIFGEITPKTFATINNTKLALSYASSIYLITKLLTPVVYIINKLSTAILIILRIDSKQSKRIMTERELRTIVDVSHEEGVIE